MTERNSTNHHASLRFSEERARGEHASDDDVRLAEVADLAEARLHARAAQGEVEAIESVWRRNRRWIAAVLAAHAPRGVEIEDLLQEVAATFLAKAREIRDAASVRGWLRVVAVNEARMAARDRGIERKSLARFAASWRGESADRHAAAEARETLELLARLPAQYAEPLLLQAGQGLSQREIAEILDVPETTIETRLARARRMLRQLVAEEESRIEESRREESRRDELRREEARTTGNHDVTKQRTGTEVHGSMMR
jgi:RNA polymerase sigma-70 factor (ECF subfamily)